MRLQTPRSLANASEGWFRLTLAAAVASVGCDYQYHARPASVPQDAVRIPGPSGIDLWQHCRIDAIKKECYCRVANVAGEPISEGVYVAIVGEIPHKSGGSQDSPPTGGNVWVVLDNGTILAPQARLSEIRKFLERAGRVRKTANVRFTPRLSFSP